ncbi:MULTISPECIES: hypothetical protein [Protofrankia]|uniref:Extradiol ring-cleavage dioxygenase class III protein subunit B n=1 Tax=Candidatus Protofrankia datiscae TaxID=2716812 RepID=F8B385_9ACTN|nr:MULTISPECIES: hypothetical protein [Protofrankia]AEH10885.1 hypothetical protein FsymDg_3606 [Candidatus Protofrankia datiscae]
MTLTAAVVCPHPPLLVPELAAGEPVAVREPAIQAVRRLVAGGPDAVVVVGDAPRTRPYAAGESGSLAGYGVPLLVTLGSATPEAAPTLPLSLTVGAWLLGQVLWEGAVTGLGVSATTSAADAARLGAELAGSARRVALLVMGDGSARRTAGAPGGFDSRADGHDAAVAAALATGDAAALLSLDPALSRELMAAGRASWQVLAGARLADATLTATAHDPDITMSDTRTWSWMSRAEYVAAPYGVGYVVAVWEQGSPW